MARHLRCPRCRTIVDVYGREFPACPACGYSRRGDPDLRVRDEPPPAPESGPQAEGRLDEDIPGPSWAEPATDEPSMEPPPETSLWGRNYEGPVGKLRHPVAVVVLSIVTLGIYTLVWWLKVSREVDDAWPTARARKTMLTGTVLLVSGYAIMVVAGAGLTSIILPAYHNYLDENPDGDVAGFREDYGSYIDTSSSTLKGLVIALAIGGLALLAGSIVRLVAMIRTWKGLRDAERSVGLQAIPVGLVTTFAILNLLIGGPTSVRPSGESASAASVLSTMAGLLAFAMLIVNWSLTQVHLNRLWRSSATPPA